jgi:iron(III) transport system ATP-binding protein
VLESIIAWSLSHRVAVMRDGLVVELAPPQTLYLHPRSVFAARFVGQADLFPCTVLRGEGAALWLRTPLGDLLAHGPQPAGQEALSLLIRPEHVTILSPGSAGPNVLQGTITRVVFSGRLVEYAVVLAGGATLRVQATSATLHQQGEAVSLYLPPERCVVVQGDRDADT